MLDFLGWLVNIRVNVDTETLSASEEVLHELDGLYGNIYFSVIVHHNGANDCHEKLCVQETRFSEFVTRANSVLASHGLPVQRSFGKRPPCSLIVPNKYFVDCNFDVYGCDCLINHPECKIGTIDGEGRLMLSPTYYHQRNTSVSYNEKCRACKWAPACGGGCPATKYINEGKLACQCIVDQQSLDEYLIDYIGRNA